ncbi:uncharacterized mitochondrial protein AtMg00810-like [Dioscorea cayenensis subsp. rotundata]|uniref:Uncharacterized mitochondrial protein AtMg00810-like n=1 Tax=Dioscorea cayennensis subsp. rotundata TaxID=55577 RepID=A0AB40CB18_DIOCR|nr:uncharacterized mitochondrial protein AtMg00810-like [Dioscorea cayenensis subsp. rotundata]
MQVDYDASLKNQTWELVPHYPSHNIVACRWLYRIKKRPDGPRAWYNALKAYLLSMGFFKSESDSSLFIKHAYAITVYLLVYVDDIIVTGSDHVVVQQVISSLATHFSLKDLGPLDYFLRVEILRHSDCLFLSQSHYFSDILQDATMQNCNPAKTPMSSSAIYHVCDGYPPTDATKYRQVVGKLQYLSFTRPDISYSINKLSQFMHTPSALYWQAVKRVLQYLQGTIHHGLCLRKSDALNLVMFSDADWAGDINDRTSTSGYVQFLGHNPISRSFNKQTTIARFSTEAEYRAVASGLAKTT